MNKLTSQKVIFSQTISHNPQEEDATLLKAYNRYNEELLNKS